MLAAASAILARDYALGDCTLQPLSGELDANYRVEQGGQRYLFKLLGAQSNPALVQLQCDTLRHVASAAPALSVPRVFGPLVGDAGWLDLHGQPEAEAARAALLLGFLDGVPLSDVACTRAHWRQIGALLAHLDKVLAGYTHPAARRMLAWDIQHVMTLQPLAARIEDGADRQLLQAQFRHYGEQVQGLIPYLPCQVIYNDCNPYNILVATDDPTRIAGLIDFGDVVYSQRVNDLAIAASYGLDGPDPVLGDADAMIHAYHAVNPLSGVEQALLGEQIKARLMTTICITESRARKEPENAAYILRNNPTAWRGLRKLARFTQEQLRERVEAACREEPAS